MNKKVINIKDYQKSAVDRFLDILTPEQQYEFSKVCEIIQAEEETLVKKVMQDSTKRMANVLIGLFKVSKDEQNKVEFKFIQECINSYLMMFTQPPEDKK